MPMRATADPSGMAMPPLADARPLVGSPSTDGATPLAAVVRALDGGSGVTSFVSGQARDVLGCEPDDWVAEPGFWAARIHPDDAPGAQAAVQHVLETGAPVRVRYRFRAHDGAYRWFEDTVTRLDGPDGRRTLVGTMVEVGDERSPREPPRSTGRSQVAAPAVGAGETAQAAGLPLHQRIVDNLFDGVYYVDRERRISYWNRGAERLTGYAAAEVVGRLCHDSLLCHVDEKGRSLCDAACPLAETIADGHERQTLAWLRHANGQRVPVEIRTAPIRADSGEVVGGVEIFSDAAGLVEARDAADAARRDALTDVLTGLPNRRLLDAVLAARQDDLDRYRLPFALLLVDVDRVKSLNDTYGSEVGDDALRVVAATLRGGLRSGDTIVRWGGEGFGVVASQVDANGVHRLAERLLRLVRATAVPFHGGWLPVSVSIGGALAHPGEAPDALIVRADQAMLAATSSGRDRFVLNEPLAGRTAPRQFGVRW